MAKLFKHPKSGFWWVRYFENGKRRRVSTRCKKKEDANYALATIYLPLEINTWNKSTVIQIKKGIQTALIEYRDIVLPIGDGEKRKALGTVNRQQRNATNFLEYLQKKNLLNFSEITEETISDYMKRYLVLLKKKMDNSVYKDIQICKTFFKWAYQKGYCASDPAVNVRNKKPSARLPKYLTHKEVQLVFEGDQEHEGAKEPYLFIYKLMYYTGLRIQELLNVEWGDIQLDQKRITIPPREGNKAKRDTSVQLNAKAVAIIEKLSAEKKGKYLFMNGNGNQYDQGKIYVYTVRLYERLGISVKSALHIWRHTCATHLALAGVPLYDISKILRHKSIRETEVYASLTDSSLQAAVDKLSL